MIQVGGGCETRKASVCRLMMLVIDEIGQPAGFDLFSLLTWWQLESKKEDSTAPISVSFHLWPADGLRG